MGTDPSEIQRESLLIQRNDFYGVEPALFSVHPHVFISYINCLRKILGKCPKTRSFCWREIPFGVFRCGVHIKVKTESNLHLRQILYPILRFYKVYLLADCAVRRNGEVVLC